MSESRQDDNPRNGLKIGYLVTGLVFLGLAGSWALRAGGVIDDPGLGWLFPAVLVGAGVIGLLAMVASGARRNRGGAQRLADDHPLTPYGDPAVPDDDQDTHAIFTQERP